MNLLFLLFFASILVWIILIIYLQKNQQALKRLFILLLIIFPIEIAVFFQQVNKEPNEILNRNQNTQIAPLISHAEANNTSRFEAPIIKIKEQILLEAPIIRQLPELPRGCEVTSLAMLLQYANINIDKLTLATEIVKDSTPYQVKDGAIYYGNPNDGFIGDMYSYSQRGFGVYHKPIQQLAEKYMPNQMIDITGVDFEELKIYLSDHRPVWVITNTSYKKLPQSQFQTWNTPIGKVQVTLKEHSVLITGYDQQHVYFNDPLTGEKNKKAPLSEFEESWVQMGKQAITYKPS
ncbi:C39 family peptidase [Bacillus sp. 03113]|uniref:C39 family peptidase n=1 Tax=Bacillus sp. 03113 TaxID=2578211 RepID=UPI0011437536|nr:C39 family peptidase [Bacillus sp. 03113]